jgi:mRNA interferase MazF
MKNFESWFPIKSKLDLSAHKPPFVTEGDIWWASIGENVGSEIGGKSNKFTRPVIILRKLSHGFYFVIPTSTKEKDGSWYVKFTQADIVTVACLHQARAIDYRRLFSKLGTLDGVDFENIKAGFQRLYIK